MLQTYISEDHDLLRPWADDTLPKVLSYGYFDASFMLVGRVLLADRVGKETIVRIKRHDINSILNVDYTDDFDVCAYLIRDARTDRSVIEGAEIPEGYEEQKDIRQSAELFVDMKVLVNREQRKTVILINKFNIDIVHYLVGLFRRLLPWYFENKPLTDNEKAYLCSFTKESERDNALALKAVMHDKQELFRNGKIEYIMRNFQQSLRKNQMLALENSNANIRQQIKEFFERISEYNRELEDNNLRLLGYRAMDEENGNALVDFIKADEDIEIDSERTKSDEIVITIKTDFSDYDPDAFETMLEDENSLFYSDGYNDRYSTTFEFKTRQAKKKFWQAIYDGTYKIRMKATYALNVKNNSVEGWTEATDDTYFPNPHVYHYHCLGSYQTQIVQFLMRGNIPGAISTCKVSAGSVNLQESTTMQRFMQDIYSTFFENKFLEDCNGNILSPKEVLEELM